VTLVRDRERGIVFDGAAIRPTLLERARGRWSGTGGCSHWALLRRAGALHEAGGPRFLLRVDDFPRWDRGPEPFVRFHEILRDAAVPYVLGVIPRPALDPADAGDGHDRAWTADETAIVTALGGGTELALHGLTHRRRPGAVPSEIVGCGAAALERSLDEGLAILAGAGGRPRAYIPPFNAVDHEALAVLARRFDAVLAGPESVRWLGCVPGPCRLDDVWLLPSYPPAYGRAAQVLPFVERVRGGAAPVLVPVTLHWAWEQADGFEAVRRLAAALAGRAVALSAWLEGRAWA
jgi:peptidoglycan/xylan/chitin deacetylase (PgdA/CDA1 family)